MPLQLRKAIMRNAFVNAVLCFAGSLALAGFLWGLSVPGVAWLLVLSAGAGLAGAWQIARRIRAGVVQSIPAALSYVRVAPGQQVGGADMDWGAFDDYAVQLASRGFHRIGDYTVEPMAAGVAGVAACFSDADGSTLVEVQCLRVANDVQGVGGIHFSVASLVGGRIRVTTTDHPVRVANFLLCGELDVVASVPGASLMELLSRHGQVVARVCRRSGMAVTPGLTLQRYVLLQREAARQARERLAAMSGFAIATLVDDFEAAPQSQLAPAKSLMPGLVARGMAEIDAAADLAAPPPVIDGAAGG